VDKGDVLRPSFSYKSSPLVSLFFYIFIFHSMSYREQYSSAPDTHVEAVTRTNEDPIRIAIAHSFREIFGPGGGELVGQEVIDPETGQNLGYREGNTEFLIREGLERIQEATQRAVELALVIYDDTPEHMLAMGIDPEHPYEQGKWPWPHDLPVGNGQTLHDITVNVPMYTAEWKAARKAGRKDQAELIRAERERAFADTLGENNIDFLITDSITYIFQRTMAVLQEYGGRIVNYHPAVLQGPTKIPGLFPTKSALHRFQKGVIYGEGGVEIPVPHLQGHRGHGATVHETTADIDGGPIIVSREIPYLVHPDDTRQTLRHRVFAEGKEILVEGLVEYLRLKMDSVVRARQENIISRA
jgi:folate-dependent phosphoribosylglycinamide formyltransferase PurN